MHIPVDLRKLRYLIDVLGLTLEESLLVDVNLASEYGLIPQLSVVRPLASNGKRAEMEQQRPDGGDI